MRHEHSDGPWPGASRRRRHRRVEAGRGPAVAVGLMAAWAMLAAGHAGGATHEDARVLVCTAQRMVAVGPRSLAKTRTIDEIRDLAMRRRHASVEQPRFREFVVTIRPADADSPLGRDLAAACRAGGDGDPICGLLPRYTLAISAAKVAARDRDAVDDRGRVRLHGTSDATFHGAATSFSLTVDGLFTLVRRGGIDGSELEEGGCAEPPGSVSGSPPARRR